MTFQEGEGGNVRMGEGGERIATVSTVWMYPVFPLFCIEGNQGTYTVSMEIRNNCNCATRKKPWADAQTLTLISWETAHASSLSLSFPMNRSRITTPNSWVIWGWQAGTEGPRREGLSHAPCSPVPGTRYSHPPWLLLDRWTSARVNGRERRWTASQIHSLYFCDSP